MWLELLVVQISQLGKLVPHAGSDRVFDLIRAVFDEVLHFDRDLLVRR